MYSLSYLPLAEADIDAALGYISQQLQSPQAALNLLDSLDEAILRLREFPYSYSVYTPLAPLETEYRLLPVNNYAVLYTVLEEEKTVEIHRVVYAAMELSKIIL